MGQFRSREEEERRRKNLLMIPTGITLMAMILVAHLWRYPDAPRHLAENLNESYEIIQELLGW